MADDEKYTPPERSKSDVAHTLARAGVSSILVVGSAAAELFSLIIAARRVAQAGGRSRLRHSVRLGRPGYVRGPHAASVNRSARLAEAARREGLNPHCAKCGPLASNDLRHWGHLGRKRLGHT
jgi:hypothetical protein